MYSFRVQVLSGSKLYSANPYNRGQAQLSVPSGFLLALGFFPTLGELCLMKAGQAGCKRTKSVLWLLPAEA